MLQNSEPIYQFTFSPAERITSWPVSAGCLLPETGASRKWPPFDVIACRYRKEVNYALLLFCSVLQIQSFYKQYPIKGQSDCRIQQKFIIKCQKALPWQIFKSNISFRRQQNIVTYSNLKALLMYHRCELQYHFYALHNIKMNKYIKKL